MLWLGFCAWNSGIACQILDFFIRFRSDAWPGQRDGRRLFRHAVPGCFPDSKGVFWLAFCAWNSGFACQNLDVFIGSGVTFGRPEGRQSRRATIEGSLLARSLCLGTVELLARTLIFSFGSGATFGLERDGRRLFRHAVPGCFPDSKGSGLLSAPGTVELPARTLIFSFGSGVTFGPGRGTAGGRGAHRGAHRGVTILMSASARSFPLCQSQTNTESSIS